MYKKGIQIGTLMAGLSVVLGAWGAHGLQKIVTDPKLIASWDTGATYQMYHALAMIVVAILMGTFTSKGLKWAFNLFLVGIILFSGSIYTLVLLKGTQDIGLAGLGIITPIGGVCFIIGWICLLLGLKK